MKLHANFTSVRSFTILPVFLLSMGLFHGCGGLHHDHGHAGHSESQDGADDHGHAHEEVISITQYTEKSELFIEYGHLVEGTPERLLIHLTRMSDFSPVIEGSLEIRLIHPSGKTYSVTADAPARDGIFLPTITPPFSGEVSMELHLRGPEFQDVQVLDFVEVFTSEKEVPHYHEEETENANEISFLKEQQWRIEYETEVAARRTVQKAIPAVANLQLPINGHALIPAPVGGIVRMEPGEANVEVGSEVSEGQTLFTIVPAASSQGSLNKLVEEYQLAQAELGRVEKMRQLNAVSDKRLLEAEIKFQTLEAAIAQLGGKERLGDPSNLRVITESPFDGILSEVYVKPGERVDDGESLALITNPSRLILEVSVVLARLSPDSPVMDATFRPAGSATFYKVSSLGGELLNRTPLVKDDSGVAVLRFIIDNSKAGLSPGSKATANLLSGSSESTELAVPLSAIQEEEGIPLIYVQTAGETIEKRYPKLGVSDGRYTQVLSGIYPGERVVTKGAPFIRISSLSTSEMGHGHAH
jgi:membrane fusion protein, heavy metal efflux system